MRSVWTHKGAGTDARIGTARVPALPNVHQIVLPTPWEAGSVQIYLIDAEPLTLIDTGLHDDVSRRALDAALDSLGHAVDDVERVVITHYHRDHVGQVQSFRDEGVDLELCAHEDAVDMVENFSAEKDENIEETSALFSEYGVPEAVLDVMNAHRRDRMNTEAVRCEATHVDRVLRGGDRIGFKDTELEVIHAPGHTAGHILLHHLDSGALFSGDHIMGGAVPHTENYYVEGLPDPADPLQRRPRFKGLLKYRRSLKELRRMSFDTILPGYGGVIRSPDRAIRDAMLFYDVRIQRIERSLRSVSAIGQSVTAYELWQGLFPNGDPATQMRTKLLMVIGALDVLEAGGACVTERRADGVLTHRHSD
jgi:glyoxylase-like metal-dependent hydrolase (beta-lactamase superfamily II)